MEAVFNPWTVRYRALRIALIGITSLSLSNFALAEYRAELDVNYGQTQGLSNDPEDLNFTAAVFLEPVDDSRGPRAEAEFLTRASSLRYTFNLTEFATPAFGVPGVAVGESRLTNTNHSLTARYVFPDTGWIATLQGSVQNPDDVSVAGSFDTDTTAYGVLAGVGYYLDDSTTVELFAGYSEFNGDTTNLLDCATFGIVDPNCENIGVDTDFDTETFTVSALLRRVGKIGNAVFSTTVGVGYANFDLTNSGPEASIIGDVDPTLTDTPLPGFESVTTSDSDDSINVLLAGTWYPINDLGVDLNYAFESAGPVDGHTIGTAVGWFVTPSIELRGSYEVTFFNGSSDGVIDGSDTSRVWRATLRARF